MAISIRNPRVEALARDVARRAGENMTQAIERALEQRLSQLRTQREKQATIRKVGQIVARFNRRPTLDPRSPDEILGYDELGLPR
jgi:antitoxin VapB